MGVARSQHHIGLMAVDSRAQAFQVGGAHDFHAGAGGAYRFKTCADDRGRGRDQQTDHAASATAGATRMVTSRVAVRSPRRNSRRTRPPAASSAWYKSSVERKGLPPAPMSR